MIYPSFAINQLFIGYNNIMSERKNKCWGVSGMSDAAIEEAKRRAKLAKKPMAKFLEQLIFESQTKKIEDKTPAQNQNIKSNEDLPFINLLRPIKRPRRSLWEFLKSS